MRPRPSCSSRWPPGCATRSAISRRSCAACWRRASDVTDAADLQRYLQAAREALVWKLDGLPEHLVRRPMTPTGTNLLGLVKHAAGVEAGYFGQVFGRSFPEPLPWAAVDAEPNADMFATPEESMSAIVALYRRVWTHSDVTLAELPLDARGEVPWWPPERRDVTLGRTRCTSSPTSTGTPDTPTSCARRSTASQACEPTAPACPTSTGPHTARGSRP